MSAYPGRGMLRITATAGSITLEHAETGQVFEFERRDLDEVIGTLAIFRASLEAAEDGELDDELDGFTDE